MKIITLTTVIWLMTSIVYSQELPTDSVTGKIVYEEVVQAENFSKADLYSNALEWFALKYNSANDVIQLKDENSGKIIGKGLFKIVYYTRAPSIYHTISIYAKDGRYKYVISDLSYKDNQGDAFALEDFPKSWAGKKKLYIKADEEIKLLITDLKKGMIKSNTDKNDW